MFLFLLRFFRLCIRGAPTNLERCHLLLACFILEFAGKRDLQIWGNSGYSTWQIQVKLFTKCWFKIWRRRRKKKLKKIGCMEADEQLG